MLPFAKFSDIFQTHSYPHLVSGKSACECSKQLSFQKIGGLFAVPQGSSIASKRSSYASMRCSYTFRGSSYISRECLTVVWKMWTRFWWMMEEKKLMWITKCLWKISDD